MDSAKAAVKDFMAKAGHHDTTVHEKVAPAVTHETINRTQHEDVQTAVDKEVHQDHYHTSVQPVVDQQQLPEQHHHNIIPVEHRQFDHDNADKVQQRLQTEQAQFRDQQDRVEGEKTHSVAPVVAGEHIHHHVHETIQPVVNKQTIEPHVVHTTVPIHEVHHNATQHHATSALPAVSMGDFKKQGGVLGGREERYDGFQGEPRQIGGSVGNESSSAMGASGLRGEGTDLAGSNTHSHHSHGNDLTGANTHSHHSHGNDLAGNNTTSSRGVGNDLTGNTNTSNPSHTFGTTEPAAGTHKKPGLMDKLNPKKDTDGDGKAGFMD